MPVKNHDFAETPDDDVIIWRFINLAKFLDLLQSQKLFFCKTSELTDPCEGMNNAAAFSMDYWRKFRQQAFEASSVTDEMLQQDIKNAKTEMKIWKRRTAVNCWHISDYEPEAFWKLYSDKEFGVAIKSTVGSLKASLSVEKRTLFLGKINYINYENQVAPKSVLAPMFYKRLSYSHEKELRVLLWTDENNYITDEVKKGGEYINVDLSLLIKSIVLSPDAPLWFRKLITNILIDKKINVDVTSSEINLLPTYLRED